MPIRLPATTKKKETEFLIGSPSNNLQYLNQGKSNFLDAPKKVRYPNYIQNADMPEFNLDTFVSDLSSKIKENQFDANLIEFDPVSGSMDSGSDFSEMPVIPSFDPLSTAFNIASIGLKIFGGLQKSEAQRKEADEIQKYYNDLASFEEKQAAQVGYQYGLKGESLQREAEAMAGEQAIRAASAGYVGQSLQDLSTISAMSLKIDKELLKSSAASVKSAADEKAKKLREIGRRKKELGYESADQTTLANAGSVMFGKLLG